jgi:hypothetical protein
VPAKACGGPGFVFFLEQKVHYLPEGAVQVRIDLDTEPAGNSMLKSWEASGTIIEVINGSPEFVLLGSDVIIDLRTQGTSCDSVGAPNPEKFVVGFLTVRAHQGATRLMLEPIAYGSRRSFAEEKETARLYDER